MSAKDFVSMVRGNKNIFKDYQSFPSLFNVILGCINDVDCKPDEKCDQDSNICKKQCKDKTDCKGDNQTCDTINGFCVNGKIYINTTHFEFIFPFQGCTKDSDCRPGEECDEPTNTCRKPCRERKDCEGSKQTCDTHRGFCVPGMIFFLHENYFHGQASRMQS